MNSASGRVCGFYIVLFMSQIKSVPQCVIVFSGALMRILLCVIFRRTLLHSDKKTRLSAQSHDVVKMYNLFKLSKLATICRDSDKKQVELARFIDVTNRYVLLMKLQSGKLR